MHVLIACEVSGRVRDAMRDQGHDAWSCDILGPESDVPGFSPAQWAETWHVQRWPACLWTRGLPALIPTHRKPAKVAHRVHMTSPGADRWYWRSRTPEAVANAFATQWGGNVTATPLH